MSSLNIKKISNIVNLKFICLILFFCFVFYLLIGGISSLGLEYDELLSINAALGCPNPDMFLHYAKYPFGICFPGMLMQYIGAPIAILPWISVHLFPPSVWAIRGFNMVVLCISLILFFLVLKKKYNLNLAIFTIFFLIFDNQFILTQQLDRPTVFPFIIRLALISSFLINYRYNYFIIGFLTGILIYAKLDSLFFLAAFYPSLILGWMVYQKDPVKDLLKIAPKIPRIGLLFILGAGLAMFPMIRYMQWNWREVLTVLADYRRYTAGETFYSRTESFLAQLTNSELFFYVFHQNMNLMDLTIFGAKVLALIWLVVSLYLLFYKKYAWIGLTVICFYLIYLSTSSLEGSHHRLIIYPFPQLAVSALFSELYTPVKVNIKKIKINILINSLLIFLKNNFLILGTVIIYILVFIPIYLQTREFEDKTCGTISFNCSIYSLANDLKNEKKTVVMADWGIATQVLYLTSGTINMKEVAFDALNDQLPEYSKLVKPYLDDCSTIVLRYPGLAKFFPADDMTRKLLKGYPNYYPTVIYDQFGKPQYQIYKAKGCLISKSSKSS